MRADGRSVYLFECTVEDRRNGGRLYVTLHDVGATARQARLNLSANLRKLGWALVQVDAGRPAPKSA